jgi:hypothetical protein
MIRHRSTMVSQTGPGSAPERNSWVDGSSVLAIASPTVYESGGIMRFFNSIQLGVFLLGLALGPVALLSGCGSKIQNDQIVAPNPPESPQAQAERRRIMQENLRKQAR